MSTNKVSRFIDMFAGFVRFVPVVLAAAVLVLTSCQPPTQSVPGGNNTSGLTVTATPVGNTIRISWPVPANEGSVKEYVIRLRGNGGPVTFKDASNADVTEARIATGLAAGGTYSYTIANVPNGTFTVEVSIVDKTTDKERKPSSPKSPTTVSSQASPPSAPLELSGERRRAADDPTKQIVTLTWTKPANAGKTREGDNASITGYTVYWALGSTVGAGSQNRKEINAVGSNEPLTTAEITGLTANQAYAFIVTAKNNAGLVGEAGNIFALNALAANDRTFSYKDDGALKTHNDKFSLGDFDYTRLIKAVFADYGGQNIKQKVSVSVGGTEVHAGTVADLAVSVSGTAYFGISGMDYAAWAGITDGADVTITATLYKPDETTVIKSGSFTPKKTSNTSIYTWRDLQNMKHKLDGSYTLQNNIGFPRKDTQGFGGFIPVGPTFTGTLDGGSKTVTGLYISQTGDNVGLFGAIGGGEVKNLKLIDPEVSGGSGVGAFAGSVSGDAKLRRLEASRTVGTMVNGTGNVGGLAGYTAESSTATVVGIVAGKVSGTGNNVGGLAGTVGSGSTVIGIASGQVSSTGGNVGGLAGAVSPGVVVNSAGKVHGYWDKDATGQNASAGGTGISKIADVRYAGGRYFDGDTEVFNDTEWLKYFRLPGESGKWSSLLTDSSTRPDAPALNDIGASDVVVTGSGAKLKVSLSWSAPGSAGKKADGTTDASISKYTVYWRTADGASGNRDFTATTAEIDNLDPEKTYFFTVKATSDAGRESLPAGDKTASTPAAKDILTFVFTKSDNTQLAADVTASINQTAKTISFEVPKGTDVSNLKPTITVSPGASVSPTTAQNFTSPVTYTVTARNGTSTQEYRVTATITAASIVYKDDAALKAHNGKFSLGDFDYPRLFKAVLTGFADETIKRKVAVSAGGTVIHAGTVGDLAVPTDGTAYFGITRMAYDTWAEITDNTAVTLTVTLYRQDGRTVFETKNFRPTKTPDGSIYTWRDLQNMKHKLDGSYTLQNSVSFPTTGTQGFGSFIPVGDIFTGKLDGDGLSVSGLYVNQTTGNNAGLFKVIRDGEVKDLKLVDPNIRGTFAVGTFAGALAGNAALRRVEASRTAGTIMVNGTNHVGGLAGYTEESSTATVIGRVAGKVSGTGNNVGGLTGTVGSGSTVIGIASGEVSGTGANVGGLAGSAAGTVRGYWDKDATGRNASPGGGTGISKLADVAYTGGRYFDGTSEVFNDAEWFKHFRLPGEGGKWPQLVIDSSTAPVAPVLNDIEADHISVTGSGTTAKMAIKLTWSVPANAGKKAGGTVNASISKYTAYWRTSDGTSRGSQDSTGTTANIANLDTDKTYVFTVNATSNANRESFYATEKMVTPPTEKKILTFVFRAADNNGLSSDEPAIIDEQAKTITATALHGIDITGLKPTITVSFGASVSPTGAQNFTNSVTYTVTSKTGERQAYTVTISRRGMIYKDDAALKTHKDKFSLGDFNNPRLFNTTQTARAGTTIKQKVSVSVGGTEVHAGTVANLAVSASGTAYFGITGMTHGVWAGITDNTDVTLTVTLYENNGTTVIETTNFKVKKTPDGSIYTWRDLQNMNSNLWGQYTVQNNFSFPAKDTQGFGKFTPIGTFRGKLDGNGKTVTGLYINETANNTGLISAIRGGEVKDLKLENPEIRGGVRTGAFAGLILEGAKLWRVEASRADGTTMVNGTYDVGGLVGNIVDQSGSGTFPNSTAIGVVAGKVNGSGGNVGGLVGHVEAGGATVIGVASGQVSGTGNTVGGLAGSATGTVRGYWDKDATGRDTSTGGGIGISKIAEVKYTGGRYFDGDTEVFNDAEWARHFRLPGESGKWASLLADSSTRPNTPVLDEIEDGHVSFTGTGASRKMKVSLSWSEPASAGKKADGTTDASISKYTVYWRTVDGRSGSENFTATAGEIVDLDGTKDPFFTVTATSNGGRESLPAEDKTFSVAAKRILTFTFMKAGNGLSKDATGTMDHAAKTIVVTLPPGTTVTSLTPTITASPGASVSPTAAQNFTNPVNYTVTAANGTTATYRVTVSAEEVLRIVYKDDAALKAHNGKFSLGDFDNPRLLKAVATAHSSTNIKQKVSVSEGNTEKHAGTVRDLAVSSDGMAYFGIHGMTHAIWAGIADNADVTITATLYQEDGSTVIKSESFTPTKTPEGSIHTWRDLQNMKYNLNGSYTLQNNIAFPTRDTQGFEKFTPVGGNFTGKLDGGEKTVSGLYINHSVNNAGLFTGISGGEVRDLKLEDPEIIGRGGVGAFAGSIGGSAVLRGVEASRSTGTMISGLTWVGGLVGWTGTSNATVIGSVAGKVSGTDYVGGLVGTVGSGNTVIGIASGEVSGTGTNVGGLAGSSAGTVRGYWDKDATTQNASPGVGTGIGKIADVTYTHGRYFDGDTEVFNDSEWFKHFRLPGEAGKWPRLVIDASTAPDAPVLNEIEADHITVTGSGTTAKMAIKLTWPAPANAGKKAGGTVNASISKYTVYWRTSDGTSRGSQDSTGTTADIANLDTDKTYVFTVNATSNANRQSFYATQKTVTPPTEKKMLSFVFRAADNTALSFDEPTIIDEQTKTVRAAALQGAVITGLKPTITVSVGASVSPTGAQDFTNPVTYTVTSKTGATQAYRVTVARKSVTYKDDAALNAHKDKFSLGDFNNPRLFKTTPTGRAGTTIKQKVSVSEGGTEKHAGTVKDLVVPQEGTAYFGITGMTHGVWAGITDNAAVTLTVTLYENNGTTVIETSYFKPKKTPDGSIYTWRDLQNMNFNHSGNYAVQNNFSFPAKNTQGFQSFTPIGRFSGKLDGNSKTITGLYINRTTKRTGLFSALANGEVKDLKLLNPEVRGGEETGAFAGDMDFNSKLLRVEATRETGTMVSGTTSVGGLVGTFSGGSNAHYSAKMVVGIVSGAVSGTSEVGGLIGNTLNPFQSGGTVIGLAYGTVTGGANSRGLIGKGNLLASSCYWDIKATGMSAEHAGATGISSIANVVRSGNVFTDNKGTAETNDDQPVFNRTPFRQYFDLPTESGKWPTLKTP